MAAKILSQYIIANNYPTNVHRNCQIINLTMSNRHSGHTSTVIMARLSAAAKPGPFCCGSSDKGKGMVLYRAVSSPLDSSKRFTLSSPGRPVHSDTVLGFSWKHSSHAAIAQRLFTHISTTVYSQI